jgi:DNA polymerase III epsilon subunit family exonuclease
MRFALPALDRLVRLVEERAAPIEASEAAQCLFASPQVPPSLAGPLVEAAIAADSRLSWSGTHVSLVHDPADLLLEKARFIVFDLETTGLSPRSSRICEIGAVRVDRLAVNASFQTLVRTGVPLPATVHRLTNLTARDLERAPSVTTAIRHLAEFAGDSTLVAHNARFDAAFLNRQLDRLSGQRLASPPIDTLTLARKLLERRSERLSLAWLAHFFGTPTRPCHRALPDATATAELLIHLVELAQEQGARTLADLRRLAAPGSPAQTGPRRRRTGRPP